MKFKSEAPRLHESLKPYLEDELQDRIEEYDDLARRRDEIRAKIAKELAEIEALDKSMSTMAKRFKKTLELFNKVCIKSDKWIFKLKSVLPTRVTPSYKQLWESALEKFNERTRNSMRELEQAHIEMKANTPTVKFSVDRVNENVFKNIFNWFKGLFNRLTNAIKGYAKAVDDLPKI